MRERTEAYRKLAPADSSAKYELTNTPSRGIAEFSARYGSWNALDVRALLGRDLGAFNYLVSFSQFRTDGTGVSNSLFANSDESRTRLTVNAGGGSGIWLGNIFFSFAAAREGLFENPLLIAQKKHALILTLRNDLFFSEKGALTHTLSGTWGKNTFDLRNTNAPAGIDISCDDYTVDTALTYDHLFSDENYLVAQLSGSWQRHNGSRFVEERWLTAFTASDGITIFPWLFVSAGITLSYGSDRMLSWYPLGLIRASAASPLAFYLRYSGSDALISFANRYGENNEPFAQSTNGAIDHVDQAEAGVEVKIPDMLRLTAYAFARGLRANSMARIITNAGMYSYEQVRESEYGAALNGELLLGDLTAALNARIVHYPVTARYELYPLFDITLTASYSRKEWGLTVSAGLPLSITSAPGRPLTVYWYPSLSVEEAFSGSIALNLKIDNIFDMSTQCMPIYPRSGREFHAGIRVKL